MPEETKERLVPVPLHILQKAARSNRSIKLILSKYLSENKLPGSQKNFEVSFDHNKEYELAEKKAKLEKEQEEIKKAEQEKQAKLDKLKTEVEKTEPVKEVKNAADNKKRS